jgi:cytochrome c-type biogenesis protein CcmI
LIYVLASAILIAALAFALWPLIRHADPEPDRQPDPAEAEHQRFRLAVEEVELDAASGRLSPEEAAARLLELRREAAP